MPMVSLTFPLLRSLPERRTRLPLPMTRDVFLRKISSVWFRRPRSSRLRMTPTRTVLRPRTDWRTTATVSSPPSPLLRLRARSLRMTRLSSLPLLMRLLPGLTPTSLPRRKSSRRSRRLLRELPCPFFSLWEEVLPQEVCLAAPCPIWAEQLLELLLLRIPLLDPPSRRSTKRSLLKCELPSFSGKHYSSISTSCIISE